MNQRLKHFLTAENLSQSQFADIVGVAKASISHILAGRNRPGFDLIESIALHFPTLSLEWLITGKGKMYGNASSSPVFEPEEQKLLFDELEEPRESLIREKNLPRTQILNSVESKINKKRAIDHLIVFYDDGTFEEIR